MPLPRQVVRSAPSRLRCALDHCVLENGGVVFCTSEVRHNPVANGLRNVGVGWRPVLEHVVIQRDRNQMRFAAIACLASERLLELVQDARTIERCLRAHQDDAVVVVDPFAHHSMQLVSGNSVLGEAERRDTVVLWWRASYNLRAKKEVIVRLNQL